MDRKPELMRQVEERSVYWRQTVHGAANPRTERAKDKTTYHSRSVHPWYPLEFAEKVTCSRV